MKLFFLFFFASFLHLSANEAVVHAFFCLNEGHLEEAKALFQTCQLDPYPPIQQFGDLGMAKILIEEKQFLEALGLLQKGEKEQFVLDELKYERLYTQADLHFRQDQLEPAIAYLEKALPKKNQANAPWRDKTLLLLSRAYLRKGEPVLAESFFQQIKEKDPLAMAQFYLEKGDLNTAMEQTFEAAAPPEAKTYVKAELLARKGNKQEALSLLEKEDFPFPLHEKQLFLLGTLYFEEKNFERAGQKFQQLVKLYPTSSLTPFALYWAGRSGDPKKYFKQLFEQYPHHPLAEEAYFHFYSPQEYLLGDRTAIKHLRDFKNKFPGSPLLLHASYLEGLDHLHDRRSLEGKWLSRQNFTEAIEAFQKVETVFSQLHLNRSDLLPLKQQATLEKAKTYLKVAESAKPPKKAIFLDYAKNSLQGLIQEAHLEDPLLEEAYFFLALTEIEGGENEKALKTLATLLAKYKDKGIENGYLLATALYRKALILNNDPSLFDEALHAGSPQFLTHEEVLNILLAKAECYRKSGALDAAMLQLSEVANYNTASGLRLKALFLRAEIYREQGRTSLAQKQLESIALKGGEWAQKAKEQLDKYYGFE